MDPEAEPTPEQMKAAEDAQKSWCEMAAAIPIQEGKVSMLEWDAEDDGYKLYPKSKDGTVLREGGASSDDGPFQVTVKGDKLEHCDDGMDPGGEQDDGSIREKPFGYSRSPICFDYDEFNYFGRLDSIYMNMASPGTEIVVSVSCPHAEDIYVIPLGETAFTPFCLPMRSSMRLTHNF
eukprot:gnl/TRDRNA2_/TRDRNA2_207486_c0_seq1.p1 gnl/TRDRNA2_/TRDRNA2_207486_c0~~gnl/TRDRNA2_/TRDRNA2_207486_c0_seq1.p1  ORF type:complete len:178 (-),score=22.37 gnl/TRDRNA2_/TRDRNA2_207486_c0_seq1:73-606(-)